MGGRARATRWIVAVVVLGVVAGACSSPRATGSSATTKAKGTLASTGAPVPSPGCSSAASASSTAALTEQRSDITVDGVDRWYLLTTPPARAGAKVEPLPLVVDLHGLAEGAALQADTSQFGAKADANGFMVVFPQGTGTPVSWNIQPATGGNPNHDIDFMKAMLDSIEAHQCVDESRVYDTGFSDGALFTSLLACTMANRFAAFAPVAGVVMDKPCNPGRKVSIVAFHGTADPILHFNGGLGTAVLNNALSGKTTPTTQLPPVNLNGKGYPANVKAWATKDGCNPSSTDTKVSAHVILRTYRCPPGTAVEFYIVKGGGHAWPGSKGSAGLAFITGPSTFEINATDIIWKFFQQHRLPLSPTR
jgi:polyhydroxybutyrate depolymerase